MLPLANTQHCAGELTGARVALTPDVHSFTPEDQPGPPAAAIADFCVRATTGRSASQ